MPYSDFYRSRSFQNQIRDIRSVTNMLCKRDNSRGGGTHFEKGYWDVRPLRLPFHALSAVPYDPHFSMFQFFKTPFSTKITNFRKFSVLEPKFTQNFVPKPQIWPKFSFLSPIYFFPKNQFFKPLFWCLPVL